MLLQPRASQRRPAAPFHPSVLSEAQPTAALRSPVVVDQLLLDPQPPFGGPCVPRPLLRSHRSVPPLLPRSATQQTPRPGCCAGSLPGSSRAGFYRRAAEVGRAAGAYLGRSARSQHAGDYDPTDGAEIPISGSSGSSKSPPPERMNILNPSLQDGNAIRTGGSSASATAANAAGVGRQHRSAPREAARCRAGKTPRTKEALQVSAAGRRGESRSRRQSPGLIATAVRLGSAREGPAAPQRSPSPAPSARPLCSPLPDSHPRRPRSAELRRVPRTAARSRTRPALTARPGSFSPGSARDLRRAPGGHLGTARPAARHHGSCSAAAPCGGAVRERSRAGQRCAATARRGG